MPRIKPFNGIRPNPRYAGKVVLDIENLSLQEAKIIRQENPYSYANMLVPKLDNLFLRGSKNELAFKKINENFDDFLDKEVLVRDTKPSIYVYRISDSEKSQTGIWTVTHVDDYLNDRIKKHELTRPEREVVLTDYLQQTGIDANPVLITYEPDRRINNFIEKVCKTTSCLSYEKNKYRHELWKVEDEQDIAILSRAFETISTAYIADGHHRAAAAARLSINQRQLQNRYNGDEEFNYFSSVYMASDQLRIYPFHRLVKDLNGYTVSMFLKRLSCDFVVQKSEKSVMPSELHDFGMYLDGIWYHLRAHEELYLGGGAVSELDVSILQDYVLSPLLHIDDPRTDKRLVFSGGILTADDLVKQVTENDYAVLFTLFPTSTDQLMKIADMGEVMLPKSTWFEPKFQAGLLVHRIG
ncbi:DUF1015 domain-containing protein [Daejeonella sp. JGW-45]|uniref:DUF1015 domain-containing protein n=1 Tax=Daejeonella sp. JGW-45 TaxID=3034148 RepID=UPI0023EE02B6|nr:DUF1015 domain-containing protein [Daejeonella sp. JGW-45]